MNLKYIEQCTKRDNSATLKWFNLPQTTLRVIKGKGPKWYRELRNEIEEKYIRGSETLITPNPWTSKGILSKMNWIVEKAINRNFLGRIILIKNNMAVANHWIIQNLNHQLAPCKDCYQNNTSLGKVKCTKKIKTNNVRIVKVDRKKRIRMDPKDLKQVQRSYEKGECKKIYNNKKGNHD
ncbi:hypothetical protein C2G38_2218805 [Gigaspora rosea]|uniref:Uncharacterized protein n=1 Tax=Gigaspora rosea TaxID=44941 RepID=A0A397U6C4_9GLOM|nr:hypothetical protein C2G38_2218805 [Gigaspora rosea]